MPISLKNEAAVAGIGLTEFSKNSGVSELSLAAQCIVAACDDAGLAPAEIDGLAVPMFASWMGFLIPGGLAIWGFRASR